MHVRRIVITAAAALALVAGGTAAGAAIASGPVSSSGVIDGCYTNAEVNGSHAFVLQDQGTACPSGTTAIEWNQTGPQGPQGPQGPAGTSGWSGQVEVTTNSAGSFSSVEILSQAGPSTLSVAVDPNNPIGLIFSGTNLPANMFPITTASGNDETGQQPQAAYVAWNTVPNTSFEILVDSPNNPETLIFNYFLPSA
jgi:hypothetical protein